MEKLFNWTSVICGMLGGILATVFGGWDKWLMALIYFIIIDYITGVIKAVYNKNISSEIGYKGILKKVLILIVVAVAVTLERLLEYTLPLRNIVICFYLANEGISLLENVAIFLPVPQKLKDILLQLRDKNTEEKTV